MSESRFTAVTVPTSETEMIDLLATRPPCWEYLLFGYYLRAGLQSTDAKWRDHMLGYSMTVGPRIASNEVADAVSERLSQMRVLASNLERVISPRAQEIAFGLPGEPGDADMIQHTADRLVLSYELLLDWASEFRSLRFSDNETELGYLAAEMVSQPIVAYRDFSQDFVAQVEGMMAQLASGDESPVHLTMSLTFDFDNGLSERVVAEVKRLMES